MARPSRYPLELRRRAVRMFAEVRGGCPNESAALRAVVQKPGHRFGRAPRNRVKRDEVDSGQRPGTTTEESAQVKALKKEIAELKPLIVRDRHHSPAAGTAPARRGIHRLPVHHHCDREQTTPPQAGHRVRWFPVRAALHLRLPEGAGGGQALVTFSAWGPLGPSVTSYSTAWPSSRFRKPEALIDVWWTNTSAPPSSGVMAP